MSEERWYERWWVPLAVVLLLIGASRGHDMYVTHQLLAELNEARAASGQDMHVVVYSTTWCPQCKRAKQFLQKNDIHYEERDVEASAEFNQQLHKLNPRGSIPTIVVNDQLMVGFSEVGLTRLLSSAAKTSPTPNAGT